MDPNGSAGGSLYELNHFEDEGISSMLKKILIAAVMSLPLMVLGSSVASAESHPDGDHRERVVGIVTGEHGQTLVLRTRHGEVDVHWSTDTECSIGGAAADCEAIEPGMLMGAIGSYSGGSDQFQADAIRARERPHDLVKVRGEILSESGQTLVVETADGVVNVVWSDETACRTRENRIECERLEPGNRILAAGRMDGSTLQARAIGLHVPADRPELARIRGEVTANHGQVMAVETRDGSVNVHFDAETVCQTRIARIDCSSIGEGSRVLAVGEELGGHNLQAKRIFVGPPTDVRPDGRDARPTDTSLTDVRPVAVTD
jgi:RNase P/RNase MRP subunit p29